MVSTGMKRYRIRNDRQAALVGPRGDNRLDVADLFQDPTPQPLRIDIGFGHGEFIAGMASSHPHERFLGVEQSDLRVTKCAHKCLKAGATNVRLFGDDAHRFVRTRLPPGSVSRAYILFPDPWPKPAHRRRRLMTRAFLLDLSWAVASGGRLVFASDTHNYTLQVLSNLTTLPGLWRDCYAPAGYRIDIPTRYPTVFERHKKAEGCTILYVMLERTAAPAPERLPWSDPGRHADDAEGAETDAERRHDRDPSR
jgi:tRNA (guanine-N7-)-methyltransferase